MKREQKVDNCFLFSLIALLPPHPAPLLQPVAAAIDMPPVRTASPKLSPIRRQSMAGGAFRLRSQILFALISSIVGGTALVDVLITTAEEAFYYQERR